MPPLRRRRLLAIATVTTSLLFFLLLDVRINVTFRYETPSTDWSSLFSFYSASNTKQQVALTPTKNSTTTTSGEDTTPVEIARDGSWKAGMSIDQFNDLNLQGFEACLNGGPCKPNQDKIIILAWGHFGGVLHGWMQGESVWSDALMDAIHALGYTQFFVYDTRQLLAFYDVYYENVHMILWEGSEEHSIPCLESRSCVYTDTTSMAPPPPPNATHANIPVWKIFHMHWWNNPGYGLGSPFTLAPENYAAWPPTIRADGRTNTYIGYSLEKTCLATPYYPYSERPRQAYVLAKRLQYFMRSDYILPAKSGNVEDQPGDPFFSNMSKELDMTFYGQFKRDDLPDRIPWPPGINMLERMSRPNFQKRLAQSRMLIGIGDPNLSPSPWEALCLGVPFIHPIKTWDKDAPEDKTKWSGQHDAMLHYGVDEPYVYHVKIGDEEGFKRAIKKAMDTPIERYMPDNMKMGNFLDRVERVLERDWRPVARRQFALTGWKPSRD